MKRIVFYFVPVLLALLSCQREVEEILNEDPPVPSDTTGVKLRVIYEIDSVSATIEDTLGVAFLSYDSQGRIVKEDLKSLTDSFVFVQQFYYQGSSKNPYLRTTYSFENYGNQSLDSTYLFYNSNDLVILDSTIYSSSIIGQDPNLNYAGKRVTDFTITSPTTVTVHSVWYAADNPDASNFEDDEQTAHVTILQNTDQLFEQNSDNDMNYELRYCKAVFSSLVNPYYGILPKYPMYAHNEFSAFWSFHKFMPSYQDEDAFDQRYIYYETDSNNRPLKISMYSPNPGVVVPIIYRFGY